RRMSSPSTGRSPDATHGRTRSSVAPSRPMTSSRAPTGGSVHVAEGTEPLLRGGVAAALLARARVRPRLEERPSEVGAHRLRPRRIECRHLATLARVVRDVVQLLGAKAARVAGVGVDVLPVARAHRVEHVALEVLLREHALAARRLPAVEREGVSLE